MKYIGLDAGSVSIKLAVLNEQGEKLLTKYEKHQGHPLAIALELLDSLETGHEYSLSLTGSAGRLLGEILGITPVNEIVAQAHATRTLYPHINTVIEMGGEDSKLILLNAEGVEDFSLNSVCAAGTGSFLDQQGERLNLSPEEMSRLALKCENPPRIAGRCSVFAKSDMIHLQQIATPMEDIVSGLCFAVARNFKGSIARGRKVVPPVSFQGGVAANKGMVRAFTEVFELDELFVPEEFAVTGAIGAALKGLEEGTVISLDTSKLRDYINKAKSFGTEGHPVLRMDGDAFYERHEKVSRDVLHPVAAATRAYLGIDIGSISTNLAVVDEQGKLLAKRYLMTAGRPIEAVRTGLAGIEEELGGRVEILGVGTTGSGRYMISDYVGADIVKNEITAQATAAAFIDPEVDTILEIGGQDSKYISLRDGVIVDFEMNKACAAGTGSFLEEQAEKLRIPIKKEFAAQAFESTCPSKLGERCTVFMENSLMANLQKGAPKDDLLAGLAYSIVQNYINRVVAGRAIGKKVFFQGGVAFNKSVVAAFEKHLGLEVTVPDNHDVTGAIGMALIAMRNMEQTGKTQSSFRGFEVGHVPYELSSFGCKSCDNMCEINKVTIEGREDRMFYGGRCEKYDINRKDTSHIEDLFKFREEALFSEVPKLRGDRPVIGIPYIFFFNETLPFWSRLLDELGFDVLVSPRTGRKIIDKGMEVVLSEACYPVKVGLGHIKHLVEQDVDAVLIPSFINMKADESDLPGIACPYTQTMPYVSRVAIDGLKVLSPIVDLPRGQRYMAKQIKSALSAYGISTRRINKAIKSAQLAQDAFTRTIKDKGLEVLETLDKRTVVIVGRSYNALERGMNLQIPEKLSTLDVLAIPMDMLPYEPITSKDALNMYWLSGQRMLGAARYIGQHEHLYPILIGNFSCGPDSFILKYIKNALGGKPYLHVEIDEHSADAGAITRCEAFLDSIENYRRDGYQHIRSRNGDGDGIDLRQYKVFIPHMNDHAYAVSAAFQRAGIDAEILPNGSTSSVEIGMKYASGKECYPCVLTTGEMMIKLKEPGVDPDKIAFFMPSGQGPCRFGQYNVFHKQVLDENGYKNVPVIAPNQDDKLYHDLKQMDKNFMANTWKGIVAVELLFKSLRETRPYEVVKGSSEEVYDRHFAALYDVLRKHDAGSVSDTLARARDDFMAIELDRSEPRPLIGMIGEIYVRSNRFSNENLVHRIEDLGGEVWLSPFEEWIHYISHVGRRYALRKGQYFVMLQTLVSEMYQHRIEKQYGKIFDGFLKRLHEPTITEVLQKAAPYVDDTFEGETVLSIGKAIDLADKGAVGIVNAMPFGCLPGTIVTALMRAISRDKGIPSITIPFDGTESSTSALQLEAFMDQAKSKMVQLK